MLLSMREGGTKNMNGGGGQNLEQLPGKINGGNCVSNCENYSVFVFEVCMYVSTKDNKNKGFSNCWTLFFAGGCKKLGQNKWSTSSSISGPHVGSSF